MCVYVEWRRSTGAGKEGFFTFFLTKITVGRQVLPDSKKEVVVCCLHSSTSGTWQTGKSSSGNFLFTKRKLHQSAPY